MAATPLPTRESTTFLHGNGRSSPSTKRKRNDIGAEPITAYTGTTEAFPSNQNTPKSSYQIGRSETQRRRSSERAKGKLRQNSLRRVKNSTDVLRKQSLQKAATLGGIEPDGISAGSKGRQFTVANVGNNGMIYLRFVYDT